MYYKYLYILILAKTDSGHYILLKLVKDQFYGIMAALPTKMYFKFSETSILKIDSEILSKIFIVIPFFQFF